MFHITGRFTIGMLCFLVLAAAASAQDNREFFEKPKTPMEFWNRMEFEIEVGKFDYAARFLKGFIKSLNDLPKGDADKILLQIEDKEGMSAFLRLNRIPSLLEDKKARKELGDEVAKLVKRVSDAVYAELKSRVPRALRNLSRSPEERAWGIAQLDRLRQEAVPYLVQALQKTEGQRGHDAILSAMLKLQDILPPLLAALDINDNELRKDILYLIRARRETGAVSELWYLTAAPRLPEPIRARARDTLAYLMEIDPDQLPSARRELTKLAERYYYHRVRLVPPDAVRVWKFDPKKNELVEQTMTTAQAEDYYGLRYGRQALDIDPTYQPAQRVVLSLLLDKVYATDNQEPPAKETPEAKKQREARAKEMQEARAAELKEVKGLMETLNPALIVEVLDQALRDHRLPVILGSLEALGNLRNVAAVHRAVRGAPVLAKALDYPDRRVQMTAADALLRTPGPVPPLESTRVVEILRRMLLAGPRPRILVAYSNQDRAESVAKNVQAAGYEPVIARDRKEALARLKEAADVDAILIDYQFPRWEREFPYVLAELRTDIDVGLLPIIVTAPSDQEVRLRRFVARYRNVWVEPERILVDPPTLKRILRKDIQESMGKPLSEAERKAYADAAIDWLGRMARGERKGFDILPAEDAVLTALHSNQPETAATAIEIAGRLPGKDAQIALANILLDPSRDKLRPLAATQLSRHIQLNGLLLNKAQVGQIRDLYASTQEPKLKASVGVVISSLHPGPALTGKRLKDFNPAPAPRGKEK